MLFFRFCGTDCVFLCSTFPVWLSRVSQSCWWHATCVGHWSVCLSHSLVEFQFFLVPNLSWCTCHVWLISPFLSRCRGRLRGTPWRHSTPWSRKSSMCNAGLMGSERPADFRHGEMIPWGEFVGKPSINNGHIYIYIIYIYIFMYKYVYLDLRSYKNILGDYVVYHLLGYRAEKLVLQHIAWFFPKQPIVGQMGPPETFDDLGLRDSSAIDHLLDRDSHLLLWYQMGPHETFDWWFGDSSAIHDLLDWDRRFLLWY